jgi:hypothetical protein
VENLIYQFIVLLDFPPRHAGSGLLFLYGFPRRVPPPAPYGALYPNFLILIFLTARGEYFDIFYGRQITEFNSSNVIRHSSFIIRQKSILRLAFSI